MAVNPYNDRTTNEIDEIASVISGWGETSKKIDKAVDNLDKTIKDLPNLIGKVASQFESSLTFATRDMNKSFKQYNNSFAKAQSEAAMKLEAEKLEAADLVKELEDTISEMELAASKSGKAVDQTVKNGLQQKLNQARIHSAELNSIKGEQAYKIQVANELKKKSLDIIANVANSLVKIYQESIANAYNKFSSTYENTYGTNTSYNAYSKAEYHAVIDSLQKFIKDNGLTNSVSINDYQEEITSILKGGLTGELATTVAKYSVLSKEGGISADFSDQSFLKLVKDIEQSGGDVEAFLSDVMTQSKAVIENVGDSFGFANGQINTMMNSLYELSTVTNMSDEALRKSTASMTALNGVLGSTKMDTTKMYEEIVTYAKEGIAGSSTQALLNYSGMTGSQFESLINSEGVGAAITKGMEGIYKLYNPAGDNKEFIKAINEATGSNYDESEIQSLLKKFPDYKSFSDAYNSALDAANKSSEEKYLDKLEDYQTEQEKLNNTTENIMSEVGQLAKHSVIIESLIGGVITAVTSTSLFGKNGIINSGTLNKIKALFSGGYGKVAANAAMPYNGQSLASFGSSASGGASALSKVGSLFNNGTAFASKGGSLAKVGSKVFSTGGKALGVAGSLISMGLDAYSGYQEDGAAGAIRGAITGSGKAAESGWDIAKGTGSAALKGAGIGMVFGPLGAAIGAAVGAVAGLTTTLIDYNSEENKRIRRFKQFDMYIESATKAVEIYEEGMRKINDLNDFAADSMSGNTKSTAELCKRFPILSKYVDENGNVTEEYNEVLQQLLDIENQKLMKEVVNTYGSDTGVTETDANTSAYNASAKTRKIEAALDMNQIVENTNNADTVKYEMSYNSKGQLVVPGTYGKNVDEILEEGRKYFNISSETWSQMTNTEKASFLKSKGFLGHYENRQPFGKDGELRATGIEIDSKPISNFLNSTEYEDSDYSDLQKYYQAAVSSAPLFDALINQPSLTVAATKYGETTDSLTAKLNAAFQNNNALMRFARSEDPALVQMFKNASGYSTVKQFKDEVFGDEDAYAVYLKFKDETKLDSPFELIDKYNITTDGRELVDGSYAVGLDYVPYDNFYARLHKGERIQTAAEANLDRARSGVDSGAMMSTLSDALVSQTDTIIGILEKIYKSISGRPSGLTGEFDTSLKSIASSI